MVRPIELNSEQGMRLMLFPQRRVNDEVEVGLERIIPVAGMQPRMCWSKRSGFRAQEGGQAVAQGASARRCGLWAGRSGFDNIEDSGLLRDLVATGAEDPVEGSESLNLGAGAEGHARNSRRGGLSPSGRGAPRGA